MSTSYRPPGFHSVTPSLMIAGCHKAIEFYKAAFGAEVRKLTTSSSNSSVVLHAEIQIGDSVLLMSDPMGDPGQPVPGNSQYSFSLYVKDIDATFNQAVAAGAIVKMPPGDMFWGDRMASVNDPYGQSWSICTRIKHLTPEQMKQAQEEFFKKQPERPNPKPAEKKSSNRGSNSKE